MLDQVSGDEDSNDGGHIWRMRRGCIQMMRRRVIKEGRVIKEHYLEGLKV